MTRHASGARRPRAASSRRLTRALAALCAVCALALPLAAFATSPAYDPAGIKDANRYQLVLVVRFAGDTIGDGDTGLNRPGYSANTEWSYQFGTTINGVPAGTAASPTLYSYLKEVSGGKVRLKSVTPQADEATGRVAYLTLPNSRAYYEKFGSGGSEVLAADAVAAFNATYKTFDVGVLDSNGDGTADNLLVIPEVGNDAPKDGASPLWPRRSDIGSETYLVGGGSRVRAVGFTLVDTSHLQGAGTVIHETIHAFGAKDLYRAGSFVESAGGKPVGVWDIMAQHGGSKLMRPLVITLEDCGWASLGEVSAGTHTLYAPGSGKPQAVMFKSPLSDSEYFVAEFRKANTNIGDLSALDTSDGTPSTIGGSGLIVYRVNPPHKETGNGNKGDKDYVYVFRPGETTANDGVRGDGAGDVRNAQLSASGRKSLGTAEMDKGLADGAITYSSGQNSGIVVTVKGQAADSITFEVAYPDYDASGIWQMVTNADGSNPLPTSGIIGARVTSDGSKAYVLTSAGTANSFTTRIFTYDGASWASLGVIAQGPDAYGLCVLNGTPYVLLSDHSNLIVKAYGSGVWREVARVAASNSTPAIGVAGGKVYVFADRSDGQSRLYALEGSTLREQAGGAPCGHPTNPVIAEVAGKPTVICGNFARNEATSQKTGAWTYEGGAWTLKTLWDLSATSVSAAVSGSATYALLANQDGATAVMSLVAGSGSKTTNLDDALPKTMTASLAARGGVLYAAVTERGAFNPVRVYHAPAADCSRWTPLGASVAANASGSDVALLDDKVYCAAYDSVSGTVSLRRYQAPDVSGPTAISIASAAVTGVTSKTYDGTAKTQNIAVTVSGVKLVQGADYTVSYASNVNAGTATMTLTGKGRYTGKKTVPFTINRANLKAASIAAIPNQTYTGAALRPVPTVTLGGKRVDPANYAVSYANNVKAGTATVTVTARSANYQGSRSASFKIVAPAPPKPDKPTTPTTPPAPSKPQMPACAPGWQNVGGTWYYGTPAGVRATGWVAVGGTWYYLDPATGAMRTGWVNDRGTWYFLHGSGAMATGWLNLGGTWYWLEGSGAMATGWRWVGGAWYYLHGSGAMAVGWANVGGTWYYLHGSGAMATGWLRTGGAWYYLHGSGAMATGWLNLGGTWYYLYGSGAMAASTWVGDYYLTGSGAMATNTWIGPWRVGADGRWIR